MLGRGYGRWLEAERLRDYGLFEAAAKVDGRGSADLIRWVLRNDTSDWRLDWMKRRKGFASAAEFRAWFAEIRGLSPAH